MLQEATVNIISHHTCNKMYDDAVTPRMLCAGNVQGGVDACQVSVHLVTVCVLVSVRGSYIHVFVRTGRLWGTFSVSGTGPQVVSSRHCELG